MMWQFKNIYIHYTNFIYVISSEILIRKFSLIFLEFHAFSVTCALCQPILHANGEKRIEIFNKHEGPHGKPRAQVR